VGYEVQTCRTCLVGHNVRGGRAGQEGSAGGHETTPAQPLDEIATVVG